MPLVSESCRNCYARRLHNNRHKAYKAGKKLPKQYAKPFEEIQLFPGRLEEPLKHKNPERIFVGSMAEIFSPKVQGEFVFKVIHTAYQANWHTYLFLTKRIERMADFFKTYYSSLKASNKQVPIPHFHLGASISNQPEADRIIPILLQIPAAVRWLSIEPMLEKIWIGSCLGISEAVIPTPFYGAKRYDHFYKKEWSLPGLKETPAKISQAVVGCESGPKRRECKLEWVKSIVEQCKAAGVSVFVKQLSINGKVEHDMSKFPKDLQIRQYPKSPVVARLNLYHI